MDADVEKSDTECPTSGSNTPAFLEDGASRPAKAGGMSLGREVCFIFVICMAQFLNQAGLSQSIAPLDAIGQSFGVTDEAVLSWYPAAFSLTVGTFIMPAGQLGDIYGYKRMFIIGFIWYGVWSLVAGVAVYSGDILFSIARAFQGVGCAILLPNALAKVGNAYDAGPKKNMIFALFGAAAPTGSVTGAVFACLFAQLAWWPWAFWVLAIVCVIMAVAAYFAIPDDDLDPSRNTDFDWMGCITGVSGLVLFNFAWNQAAVVGWQTVYTYVLLIVGILLLAAFVWVELKVDHPLVPIAAFHAEAGLALAVLAAGWASFGIWFFYEWRLLEELRGYTLLSAAAQNTPLAISGMLAAITTGFLLSRIKVPYVLLLSMLAFSVGQILIATAPIDQTYWSQTFVAFLIMPWGMDMSFPSSTVLLSNSTSKENQGIAASLVNTVVNYSISIGLGVAGTIIRNVKQNGADTLQQYRSAWYFAIGTDVIGVLIALYFVLKHR